MVVEKIFMSEDIGTENSTAREPISTRMGINTLANIRKTKRTVRAPIPVVQIP